MLIAVDPGTGGTGVVWGTSSDNLLCAVVSSKAKTWEAKARHIVAGAVDVISKIGDADLVIERPFMATRGKARASATKGDVVKVSLIAGGIAFGAHGLRPYWLDVGTWKGNLPKSVTMSRVKAQVGPSVLKQLKTLPDHAWDAAGIWLHVHGSDIRLSAQ